MGLLVEGKLDPGKLKPSALPLTSLSGCIMRYYALLRPMVSPSSTKHTKYGLSQKDFGADNTDLNLT